MTIIKSDSITIQWQECSQFRSDFKINSGDSLCDVLLAGISEVLVAALLFSVIELAGLHNCVEGCFSFSDCEGQI